jgi:hypothetical protein
MIFTLLILTMNSQTEGYDLYRLQLLMNKFARHGLRCKPPTREPSFLLNTSLCSTLRLGSMLQNLHTITTPSPQDFNPRGEPATLPGCPVTMACVLGKFSLWSKW